VSGYTTNAMYYIVGLGNPGKEYKNTRHNIGFTVLEKFVEEKKFSSLYESGSHSGLVSEGTLENEDVTVLLPTTFMNASGSAVVKLISQSESEKLVVVYDDIDLPVGEIKISFDRGDGGHNGIKSIIEKLGTTKFTRVRIGIAQKSLWTGKLKRPKGEALASYVLGHFKATEEKELETVAKTVGEILTLFVTKGKDVAMNRFN